MGVEQALEFGLGRRRGVVKAGQFVFERAGTIHEEPVQVDTVLPAESRIGPPLFPRWTNAAIRINRRRMDLYKAIEDKLVFPAGPAVYPWPEPIPAA